MLCESKQAIESCVLITYAFITQTCLLLLLLRLMDLELCTIKQASLLGGTKGGSKGCTIRQGLKLQRSSHLSWMTDRLLTLAAQNCN